MDTAIDYATKDVAYISSDERKWINRVRSLAKLYPDLVRILFEPENNDGCIYAQIPPEWIKIIPPRKTKQLTDEEKAVIKQRLSKGRKKNAVNE